MPTEVVQIGPLIVSKAVLDMAGPLVGVLIGGLITYLTTRAMEKRRWERQKKDKLQEQRREAIGLALEWVEPIEAALTSASLLASAFMKHTISDDGLRRRWPDLVSVLAKKDIPRRLGVLLPPDTYRRGIEITLQLERLQTISLMPEPSGKVTMDERTERFDSVMQCIESAQRMLTALDRELTEEYKSTFD